MSSACWGTLFVRGIRRSQKRFWSAIAIAVLAAASCCLVACGGGGGNNGGGGGGGGITNPPPDFYLTVPAQINLQAGGAPQELEILDGGSDDYLSITLTFPTLPSGITLYGGSPYVFSGTVPAPDRDWAMAASPSAAVQSSTVTVTATNGTVTHTYPMVINVTAAAAFQISLSQSSLTLTPGGTGTIQATVTGLTNPAVSVASYPLSLPFDETTIQSAGANAFNITIYAPLDYSAQSSIPLFVSASPNTSDESQVDAPLTINIRQSFPAITAPTRSNVVRASAYADGIVYDQARKLLFVAYGSLNQVVVYSSVDQHMVAAIPVAIEPSFNESGGVIDESADGTQVYVAGPEAISTIDPVHLQVVGTSNLPLVPISSMNVPQFNGIKIAALADGNVLVLNSDNHAYLWNPPSGSITIDDPQSPVVVGGSDSLVRSADHSTALVYNSSYISSPAIVFYSGSDRWGAFIQSANTDMALSPDGLQIASACQPGDNPVVALTFYDDNFDQVGASPQRPASCAEPGGPAFPIYSLDGKTLYTFLATRDLDLAWDSQKAAPLGLIAEGDYVMETQPLAVDESGLVYGNGRGLFIPGLIVTDASHPGAIGADPNYDNGTGSEPFPFPMLRFPGAVDNGNLPVDQTGGAAILAAGFDPNVNYSVYVGVPPGDNGATPATGLNLVSSGQLNFTIPASSTPGPVNVTLTNNAGWSEVIPDGVSYGPYLLGADPSAIPPSGGTTVTLYGYGISQGSVSMGASTATTGEPSLESTFDLYYPVDENTLRTASGTPGWADLEYSNGAGTSTLHHAMQFLKSSATYPLIADYAAVVYDPVHQHVLLTNPTANQVVVFDMASSAYLTPISVGTAPTSVALTPDSSTLAVLNSTDQTVSVIDTSTLKVTATYPAVTSSEKSSDLAYASALSALGSHQMAIAAVTTAHVLDVTSGTLSCASITGCDTSGIDLQPGLRPATVSSTPDGSKVIFGDGEGHLALLDLSQNTVTTAAAQLSDASQLAADADDNEFVSNIAIYDPSLHLAIDLPAQGFDYSDGGADNTLGASVFNPSGSLLFSAANVEVLVYDVRHGNVVMRIALPDSARALTLDPTGTELLVAATSGLEVVQLYEAPLSIASVTPATGSAGTAVTIRGSGFESGTTVSFGSTPAAVEFTDAMTLRVTAPSIASGPVQITVNNPDGSSYSLDDAFVEN
ncbi:MAG: IPT/TIG domain-containing protein [Acidobacteriaceae bacterium]